MTASKVTVSWGELRAGIAQAFENERVDVEEVKQLMNSYVSCRSDWEEYEHFDKHKLVGVGYLAELYSNVREGAILASD
jgi:hypothetical protein